MGAMKSIRTVDVNTLSSPRVNGFDSTEPIEENDNEVNDFASLINLDLNQIN